MELNELDILRSELGAILLTMDIPESRLDITNIYNLNWLKRNIGIRNSGNENFKRACDLIIKLLKHETI